MTASEQYKPDLIVEILAVRGMTQERLADQMGYRPETVSRVLNGKQPLTRKFAIRVAHELGIPVYWLRADYSPEKELTHAS